MPQSPGRPGPAGWAQAGASRAPGRAASQSPGPWECPRAPGRRLPEPLGGSPTRAQGSWEWGLEWGFEYVKHRMIEFSQLLAFELQLFKTCAPSSSDLSPGWEDSGAMHEICLPSSSNSSRPVPLPLLISAQVGKTQEQCTEWQQLLRDAFQVSSATHGKRGGGCWPKALDKNPISLSKFLQPK